MAAPYDDGTQAGLSQINDTNSTFYGEVQADLDQFQVDFDNMVCLTLAEQERKTRVDFASLALAILTFDVYDNYYDKYSDVIAWRNGISNRIKACIEADVDHYISVVMSQMNSAISTVISSPRVVTNYADIINRFESYGNSAATSANALMSEMDDKNCHDCDQCGNDLQGWATMNAISAADDRARFDEGRVPRRLDLISGALDSVHSSTFNLPGLDYQALSNAAELSTSLASAYAGIANSALGSAGYFTSNFINSI